MSDHAALTRYERARTWIARTELNLTMVEMLKYSGSLAGLSGPVIVGVVTWDSTMGLMTAIAYFIGLASSFLGPLLNQGASRIEESSRIKLAHEHSFNLTAAISLLKDVQAGEFDRAQFHQQLLRQIAATADTVVHVRGARILACLLVRRGDTLELEAWSDHRDGRIPSASIPISVECGAGLTFRTRKAQYIPDIRDANVPGFDGKSYRSVLTFPIQDGEAVLGVVAVDSSEPRHFDAHLVDLDVHMRPFVQLLSFSIVGEANGA